MNTRRPSIKNKPIFDLVSYVVRETAFLLTKFHSKKSYGYTLRRGTEIYALWSILTSAKQRCFNKKNKGYRNYGARGIKVCDRWMLPNGEGFHYFVMDMGPRPLGFSLERVDVNGNYDPDNCRWIPLSEQTRNRRMVYQITHNGVTLSLAEWARKLHRSRELLRDKIFKHGRPLSEVLTPSE